MGGGLEHSLFDVLSRGLSIEARSVPGAANTLSLVVLGAAFFFGPIHNMVDRYASAGVAILVGVVNNLGRRYAARHPAYGYRWIDIETGLNPPPHQPAGWKYLILVAAFAFGCPLTLALLGY